MLISIILSHEPSSVWVFPQRRYEREDYAYAVADLVYLLDGEVVASVTGLGEAEAFGIDGESTVIVARVPDHQVGDFVETLAEHVHIFRQDRAVVIEPNDAYDVPAIEV